MKIAKYQYFHDDDSEWKIPKYQYFHDEDSEREDDGDGEDVQWVVW